MYTWCLPVVNTIAHMHPAGLAIFFGSNGLSSNAEEHLKDVGLAHGLQQQGLALPAALGGSMPSNCLILRKVQS